jgi:hypothetical protein
MNPLQYRQLIHVAYYRIIRIGAPPLLAVFLAMTLDDTWPDGPAPADFPDFWWEALALEIQKSLIARDWFWRGLSAAHLKAAHAANKTWEQVAAEGQPNLASLNLLAP